jgi:hypothetical protein
MRFSFFIALAVFLFGGCTKKKGEISETSATQSQSTDNCDYHSTYDIVQNYCVANNTLQARGRSVIVDVYKYCPPAHGPMNIGFNSILLNSQPLDFFYDYFTLSRDSIPQTATNSFVWTLNAQSGYPSFTKTITDSMPRFTKYHLLPDSISMSNLTTVQLDYANATGVNVYIDNIEMHNLYNTDGGIYPITYVATPTSITFSYNPNMGSSTTASLVISCFKTYTQTVDNKTMNFALATHYKKKIYFKN